MTSSGSSGAPRCALQARRADLVAYCAFDILVADGRSVMDEQLMPSKERLAEVFSQRPDQLRS